MADAKPGEREHGAGEQHGGEEQLAARERGIGGRMARGGAPYGKALDEHVEARNEHAEAARCENDAEETHENREKATGRRDAVETGAKAP